MEEEEDTIIIEVTNEDWSEGDDTGYQVPDFASVEYEEVESVKPEFEVVGEVTSYTEEVDTRVLHDGQETNMRVVTYENIPVLGGPRIKTVQKIDALDIQNGDVEESEVLQSNEIHTDVKPKGESLHKYKCSTKTTEILKPFEYACTYCPMTYSNKSVLKAHLWIHPQHKPFKCQVCNSTFRSKLDVDEHAKRHFYNKNFFCRLCGTSLSCKAACIKHMKKTHEVEGNDINLFMLKEVPSDEKMVLVIRTVRNGMVYKRKFEMMKDT